MSKGDANRQSIGERMKEYEAVTTSATLVKRLPLYARLDMRAGHTFCRGLDKPFDLDYANTMQEVTRQLVVKLGAAVGYTQSDEISLVWKDTSQAPFENRLFKLESVFAGMASAMFAVIGSKTKLKDKIERIFPCFDCRVLNLPNLAEAANMLQWREQDAIKNGITLLALEHFSNKDIFKKNSDDKIKMLAAIGIDYFDTPREFRNGAYFAREVVDRTMSNIELGQIPEKHRPKPSPDGFVHVIRTVVNAFSLNCNLSDMDMESKIKALFADRTLIKDDESGAEYYES